MARYFFYSAIIFLHYSIAAQKGLPSATPTSAHVYTNYPAHEDFREDMLNRLKVAEGYTVKIAATGLGKPRMMAAGPDGSLYITRRDQGDVLLLSKPGKDNRFTSLNTVVTKFSGVHGITVHNGYLYLCSNTELRRARLNENGMPGAMETLIKDLPDGGQHGNRTIAFGPDRSLYISIGSDCNDCSETNALHATITKVNEDGTNRRIYARGLRNTIGFDWHPKTKELWGMDNGTDWRGDDIPPEELNKIREGADYGWPWVYGKQQIDYSREDPVGTTKEEYAKTTQPAVLAFPAHSAPINFIFLPDGDALVSWHGSWNRQHPEGYKVQRIHFINGSPVSTTDFLRGFLSADGKSRFGRPAGLLYTNSGIIYVSDDENGVIYALVPVK